MAEQKLSKEEMLQYFIDQAEGKASRTYPEGRIGAQDEGQLVCMLVADKKHGRVFMQYPRPISWLAMTPQEACDLARRLIHYAKRTTDTPLVVDLSPIPDEPT